MLMLKKLCRKAVTMSKRDRTDSNTDRVLQYMKENKGITSLEAFRELGETRLSAAIYILKHRGYNIHSKWLTSENRYGKKVKYKRYTLS